MSWLKLDDGFPDHPKVVQVGGDAAWLHVCALCYCAQHLTDGVIPAAMVARLSDRKRPDLLAARLVEAGLWETGDDVFLVHDYLTYNPSREKVVADRDRRRMAGKKGADSRWHGESHGTSHSKPHADRIDNDDAPDPARPEVPTEPSIEPKGSQRKRGTRIPDSFALTAELRSWSKKETPAVDPDREFPRFVDYWRGRAGQAGVKLDWPATFRNWMRNQADRQPQNGQPGYQWEPVV